MDKQLIVKLKNVFDDISHQTEDGVEYWLARELQYALGYKHWERFYSTLNRAIMSCKESGGLVNDHFREKPKLTNIGFNCTREIVDYALIRYACHLIAQNCDPHKNKVVMKN